ncbi:MAG: aldo/keto reductase [Halioglobus sp.]
MGVRLAEEAGCTPGQLALNWLLEQDDTIIPIPGTRTIAHLDENMRTAELVIDPSVLSAAGELTGTASVVGGRYPDAIQLQIDTEEF